MIIKIINLKNTISSKSLELNINTLLNRDLQDIKYINIIVKIKTVNNKFISLTKFLCVNLTDKNEVIKWKKQILSNLEKMSGNYIQVAIYQIVLQYQEIDYNIYKDNLWKNPWNIVEGESKTLSFPMTTDYDSLALTKIERGTTTTYTDMFGFRDSKYAEMTVNKVSKNLYLVKLSIKNLEYFFNDQKDDSSLTRTFIDGTIFKKDKDMAWYFETLNKRIKTLTPLKNELVKENEKPLEYVLPELKVITLDIETWTDNKDTLHIMSVAIFSQRLNLNKFFFIKDYNSELDMIKDVFTILMSYSGFNIYIHNGARFDLIFLIKHLVELKNVLKLEFNFIYNDGELIQIEITKNSNKIVILDSLKILLSSLSDLAKVFNLDSPKGAFPFDFAKPANFSYVGPTPEYKYFAFNGKPIISKEDYSNLIKSNWNFIEELAKYNLSDCIILYEILDKFFDLFLEKFKWNISKNPTLSSLAFSLYKSSYIPEELLEEKIVKRGNKEIKIIDSKIQILDKKLDNFIRKSFFGGHVDSYISHFDNSLSLWEGQILSHYDVVSLYPAMMERFDMPYAVKIYFKGDIRENNLDLYNNSLGFYRVNIMAPDGILNPIIPYRNEQGKVIYPTGYWGGVYFSEELKNAAKFGYTFTIIEGYIFEKHNLFSNYINDLFDLKTTSKKGTAMYLMSKLLMNSLFGRFGIRPDLLNYNLIENNQLTNKNYVDKVTLSENYSLIALTNDFADVVANLAVASAITGYSRIHMSKFKNDVKHPLFYTDTDSAFTNNPLSSPLIGTNLGQMVLENRFNKFISLGPKIYGGITTTGKEIIKVKGLTKENLPTYNELEILLERGKNLEKGNLKSFRNLSLGEITLKNLPYLIKPTENKRSFIYKNNKIIGTNSINIWCPYLDD